jgi:hypothetical protein
LWFNQSILSLPLSIKRVEARVNFGQRAILAKVVVDLMEPIARRTLKSAVGQNYSRKLKTKAALSKLFEACA